MKSIFYAILFAAALLSSSGASAADVVTEGAAAAAIGKLSKRSYKLSSALFITTFDNLSRGRIKCKWAVVPASIDPSPSKAPASHDDDHEARSGLHTSPVSIDFSKATDDPDY